MNVKGFTKRSRGRPQGAGPTVAERIRTDIRRQILNGLMQPGERLPSEQELARQYRVAVKTLRNAQRSLVQEGLILKERRHGTFVCKQAAEHRRVLLVCGLNPEPDGDTAGLASDFYLDSLRFCKQAALARGLSVDTEWVPNDESLTLDENHVYFRSGFSGIIFLGCSGENPLLRLARQEGVHHVNLSKSYYMPERTVWFEMEEAARMGWEDQREIVEKCGLEVVVVTVEGEESGAMALARLVPHGIRHALIPNRLGPREVERLGYQFIRRLCADRRNGRGYIFLDEVLARGGTRALLEAGLGEGRCPVIVVCGRQEMAPYGLPVTYITHDTEAEARWAVDMLVDQIEGRPAGIITRKSPFAVTAAAKHWNEEAPVVERIVALA